jgi:hypothetical protein
MQSEKISLDVVTVDKAVTAGNFRISPDAAMRRSASRWKKNPVTTVLKQ